MKKIVTVTLHFSTYEMSFRTDLLQLINFISHPITKFFLQFIKYKFENNIFSEIYLSKNVINVDEIIDYFNFRNVIVVHNINSSLDAVTFETDHD